jgi:hypothetical protein
MMHRLPSTWIVLLAIFCTLALRAQDAHYWTRQFGPKSCLLSGAVVGGVRDYSASYYNAAGLAMGDSLNGFSLTSNAYNLENIILKNAAGSGKDLSSNNPQIIPLIITGKLRLKRIPKLSIGYFLVEKEKTEFKSSARNEGFYNLIPDSISSGNEEYVSQYNIDMTLLEIAAGFSLGYRLNEHVAVGLTNYGTYRRQILVSSHVARLAPTDPNLLFTSGYTRLEDLEFQNVRATIKLSAMVDFKRVKTGLTVTMPSINVWGNAVVSLDLSYSNVYFDGLSFPISLFADDRQVLKKTRYQDPFSVALGTQIELNPKSHLYLTAEWFAPVKSYLLVQAKPNSFTRPSNSLFALNSADYLRVRESRKSTLNVALGFERIVNSRVSLLMGGRTNFYSLVIDPTDEINLNICQWNLFHASLGASYKRKKSTLFMGLLGAYGRKEHLPQMINITDPSPDSDYPLQGDLTNTMTAQYRSLSLMLGYIFYIK